MDLYYILNYNLFKLTRYFKKVKTLSSDLWILLHDNIIDWRYLLGNILRAIFCWRYFFRESLKSTY